MKKRKLEQKEQMSPLVAHADYELKLAEIDQEDADYGGMLYRAVMELIKVFAKQGHNGFSAMRTLQLFNQVAFYKNLFPLGKTKDEWIDVSEVIGKPCWQNKRNPRFFSETAGETWYNVDDKFKISINEKIKEKKWNIL